MIISKRTYSVIVTPVPVVPFKSEAGLFARNGAENAMGDPIALATPSSCANTKAQNFTNTKNIVRGVLMSLKLLSL